MDKDYFSLENQIIRREKSLLHEKNKRRFKRLLKDSDFILTPRWHLSKDDINLSYLGDDLHTELIDKWDYFLYVIDKEELFKILDQSYIKTFTKSKIWKSHDEDKIVRVLDNWENNIKLIPPVLILDMSEKKFIIQDGKHRFAVANYFDSKEIPIIILNVIKDRFLEIAIKDKIQQLS